MADPVNRSLRIWRGLSAYKAVETNLDSVELDTPNDANG
jgi:hypothetical protein